MNITSIANAAKGHLNVNSAKKLILLGSGFAKKNAPQLLTGASVASLIGAVATTAKSTIRMHALIEEREFVKYANLKEKHGEDYEPEAEEITLSLEEKFKLCWKELVIPSGLTAFSAGCMIASTSIHADRYASALAMLSLVEGDNKALKAKIEELLGKETAQQIKDSLFEDKLNKSEDGEEKHFEKADGKEVRAIVSRGKKLHFVDDYGNEWDSTVSCVEAAIREINTRFKTEQFPSYSVNEFVCLAGGNPTIDKFTVVGDQFGWPQDIMEDEDPWNVYGEDGPIDIKLDPFVDRTTDDVTIHVQYRTEPWQEFFNY